MLQRFLENSTDYAATVIGPEDSVPDSEYNHAPNRNENQEYAGSLRNGQSTQPARQINSGPNPIHPINANNHELEYAGHRQNTPTDLGSLDSPIQQRLATLQNENMLARAQYAKDQNMLEQYDQRVKLLEMELARLTSYSQQQSQAESDQISALGEQRDVWQAKYESLAKLYSQLRHEHLELLLKFKEVQEKVAMIANKNGN